MGVGAFIRVSMQIPLINYFLNQLKFLKRGEKKWAPPEKIPPTPLTKPKAKWQKNRHQKAKGDGDVW